MPELPEVETIAQGLRDTIIGLSIKRLYVTRPDIIRGPHRRRWRKATASLTGQTITAVTRRGKRLIIITSAPTGIVIQLGMTGKVILTSRNTPMPKHTHLRINLNNNKQLRFVDARRFGRVWLVDNLTQADQAPALDQAMLTAGMGKMGPEPFDITRRQFQQVLTNTRVIKTLLLDQTRIAGLGNIYCDESLFIAGIHPATCANCLATDQADALRRAIRSVLRRSIKLGGTTFSDYRNAYDQMGNFKQRLQVYQRTGQPCSRCGTPIHCIGITGRSSHFCPTCQPGRGI